MIDVYEIIKQISAKNKENGKAPDYAVFEDVQIEVTKQVKKEINSLITNRKVKHHQTINSFSFEVLEEETNKQ